MKNDTICPRETISQRETLPWPTDQLWAVDEMSWPRILNVARTAQPSDRMEARMSDLPLEQVGVVAVITIEGVLTKRPTLFQRLFGGSSTQQILAAVQQAAADESVRTILLRIDSPGGGTDGLAEVADAIFAARQRKPVIGQVTGTAASAAYFLASQAQSLFAQRMDLIGSIGTRMLLYDWSRNFEDQGILAVPIDTGEFKSAAALGTPITDRQVAHFQHIVDGFFADFVAMIVRGRPLNPDQVRQLGDGRIFLAKEAVANGLIDGIATFEETMAALTAGKVPSRNVSRGRRAAAEEDHQTESKQEIEMNPPEPKIAEAQSDSSPAGAAAPNPAAAATIEELKKAMPQSTADFREQCLELRATLPEAMELYIAEQDKRLREMSAAQSRSEQETARMQSALAAKPGVPASRAPAAASNETGESDPVVRWKTQLREKIKAGMDPATAVRTLVKEDPELHEAYVAAANAA